MEKPTPYDIKKSLTSGPKLLKNVVAMYNVNPTSWGNASILKKTRVKKRLPAD